jgi:hypothetical protein
LAVIACPFARLAGDFGACYVGVAVLAEMDLFVEMVMVVGAECY